MKEIKRTVSVNVNGKKVDIRFFEDPELIEEVDKKETMLCHFCKLKENLWYSYQYDERYQDEPPR